MPARVDHLRLLEDVDTSGAIVGDALVYAGGLWVPAAVSGGGMSGVYAAYAPTIAQNGNRTTSSLVARYTQTGKWVHAYGRAVLSNAGTAGQIITVTLPVTSAVSDARYPIGTGVIEDVGAALYPAIARLVSSGAMIFTNGATTSGQVLGQGPSFALASGDIISWNVSYEAA